MSQLFENQITLVVWYVFDFLKRTNLIVCELYCSVALNRKMFLVITSRYMICYGIPFNTDCKFRFITMKKYEALITLYSTYNTRNPVFPDTNESSL